MNWQQLKTESLKYQTVYITGCQRTGTTFCAKALAEEIGYNHIDETDFNGDNVDRFHKIDKTKAVVQCPALFHLFPSIAEGGLIVWIDRPHKEVRDSMIDSGWHQKYTVSELKKYQGEYVRVLHAKEAHAFKMRQISNFVSLPYTELQNAKGYLPKDERKNFSIKQTEC